VTDLDDWYRAYRMVYEDASRGRTVACPHCGARSLRLLFVVRNQDDEDGTAAFWCDACLHGLMPTRAPVPPTGERYVKGTESVPDYSLITGD
jgi:DNA-directed RNA polymerase subunit RPC12/RpoP